MTTAADALRCAREPAITGEPVELGAALDQAQQALEAGDATAAHGHARRALGLAAIQLRDADDRADRWVQRVERIRAAALALAPAPEGA